MKKVIFIDDDEVYNFLMEKKLKDEVPEVETVFFSSAQAALDHLGSSKEEPELIFVDVKMPVMNGFDFLDSYHERGYHNTLNSAVYMLSSSINKKDREKSKTYTSVVNFISKPLQMGELKTILAHHSLV